MRAIVLMGVAAAALAGCAGIGSPEQSDKTYIRADGQPISKEQLSADQSSCSASSNGSAFQCMVAKGYFLVAVADADVKQAQFAQIAEENRKREQARIEAELKTQKELERAARRKKKKKPPAPTNN